MSGSVELVLRRQVPSIAHVKQSLVVMQRELSSAKTYDQIRRIIKEAEAIKILLGHVYEVKAQAEDTILAASTRIGEELEKIPKAGNRFTRAGKSISRTATNVPGTSRSRLGALAKAGAQKVKKVADELRKQGKDATPRAVATQLKQGNKKKARAARERELAKKQRALPDKKYGVILADPEWQFEPWSRETGMDRAAANHYPTSCTDVIASRDVASIAAKDCVLFLCATAPMLPHAMLVMAAWGFNYVTNWELHKDRIITGYWNRNRHEHLLLGVRGKVPAPAQGEQWESVIEMTVGRHSEKPDAIHEMIEAYFPNLPKIELNARNARDGWDAWGNEAPVKEAAE